MGNEIRDSHIRNVVQAGTINGGMRIYRQQRGIAIASLIVSALLILIVVHTGTDRPQVITNPDHRTKTVEPPVTATSHQLPIAGPAVTEPSAPTETQRPGVRQPMQSIAPASAEPAVITPTTTPGGTTSATSTPAQPETTTPNPTNRPVWLGAD